MTLTTQPTSSQRPSQPSSAAKVLAKYVCERFAGMYGQRWVSMFSKSANAIATEWARRLEGYDEHAADIAIAHLDTPLWRAKLKDYPPSIYDFLEILESQKAKPTMLMEGDAMRYQHYVLDAEQMLMRRIMQAEQASKTKLFEALKRVREIIAWLESGALRSFLRCGNCEKPALAVMADGKKFCLAHAPELVKK